MEDLLDKCVDKEIEVFYWDGSEEIGVKGILRSCSNGWIALEMNDKTRCLSLSICRRIEEK